MGRSTTDGQLGTATPPHGVRAATRAGASYIGDRRRRRQLRSRSRSTPTGTSGAGAPTTPASSATARPTRARHPRSSPISTTCVAIAAGYGLQRRAARRTAPCCTWGGNGSGQLGDGTTDPHAAPAVVPGARPRHGDRGRARLDARRCATTARSARGAATAIGQIGDGTTRQRDLADDGHRHLDRESGQRRHGAELRAAGRRRPSRPGAATGPASSATAPTDDSSAPVSVSGISDATAIAAGGIHTLALLADGTVVGWGLSSTTASSARASTRSAAQTNVPLPVAGLSRRRADLNGLQRQLRARRRRRGVGARRGRPGRARGRRRDAESNPVPAQVSRPARRRRSGRQMARQPRACRS